MESYLFSALLGNLQLYFSYWESKSQKLELHHDLGYLSLVVLADG